MNTYHNMILNLDKYVSISTILIVVVVIASKVALTFFSATLYLYKIVLTAQYVYIEQILPM